jgi:hypothetical protein
MNNSNDLLYDDIRCRYFKKPGSNNTGAVMEAVKQRAEELTVNTVLVASNTGKTAFTASETLGKDFNIIVVTHVTGFREPNHQELDDDTRRELEAAGLKVLTCQHAFGGIGRAVRFKFSTYQTDEIIANALRIFGEGTKVAVELALMAADAGLIRTDRDVISIGGTGRGADTALVLRPANSFRFFDLKVKEVICKPG